MNKKIVILFGTESGNAEFAAEDMALEISHCEVEVIDMTDFDVNDFSAHNFYMIICSTHGEGDLPSGAVPFLQALDSVLPDMKGIQYAMFGLGDSSYANYSRGSEHIDKKLTALGAVRVGEYGRHDAHTGTLPNVAAVEWTRRILELGQ
ncbi:flavodoxin domain-containing protein [Aquiluna borgnonia]|uniref:Flavodoxin domain-containing protein n=1 Tax=Aquiluna borgnonia TaxID=2499157 RepID=A0A7D4Q4J6_9MICO|nr:flavodoxin domain-containing protein [Aquiluna borgnonia]QKJ25669.1 flavodoxin domain-containing protein [Aquiluna borgnonia]